MIRSSTLYDILKWIALVFLPAVAVCIASLGEVYQWQFSQQWVATCNIIGIFIGALLQRESKHYHQQQSRSKEVQHHETTENH